MVSGAAMLTTLQGLVPTKLVWHILTSLKNEGFLCPNADQQVGWKGSKPNGATWVWTENQQLLLDQQQAPILALAMAAAAGGLIPATPVCIIVTVPTSNMFRHSGKYKKRVYDKHGEGLVGKYKLGSRKLSAFADHLKKKCVNHGTDLSTYITPPNGTQLLFVAWKLNQDTSILSTQQHHQQHIAQLSMILWKMYCGKRWN